MIEKNVLKVIGNEDKDLLTVKIVPNIITQRICKTTVKRKMQINQKNKTVSISMPIHWLNRIFPDISDILKLQGTPLTLTLKEEEKYKRYMIIIVR